MDKIKLKHHISYIAIKVFLQISKTLPKWFLYSLSKSIVTISNQTSNQKRKHRILEHLSIAFGKSGDLEKIYNDYIEHISSFYVEILSIMTNRLNFEEAVINEKEAIHRLKPLINRDDRGIILLVSHYGNWEFLGHWLAINGLNGAVVAKSMKNSLINENIIIPFRTQFGNISIDRKGALISISKLLKNGGGVALLIDQMIPPPNGIEIEFFGKKAYALKSVATLKLKYDPIIVPVFAKRVDREKFEIIIKEPIEYKGEEIEDRDEKIRAMTQLYTDSLEEQIRDTPAQWQWSYKRWRLPKSSK